jgi:threonine aldolase
VAGTEEFIHEAHRWRKKLGGGMRQAGIIAAPGIVALEKMVDRLKDDHNNARLLHDRVSRMERYEVDKPDTNILFIEIEKLGMTVADLARELKRRGVLIYGEYGTRARLVTSRMVDSNDMVRVADALEEIASKA